MTRARNLSGFSSALSSTQDINTTGIVTAASFVGDGAGLTGVTASGTGILIKEDGTNVGTAGTINFSTNINVSALADGAVTVSVVSNPSVTSLVASGVITASSYVGDGSALTGTGNTTTVSTSSLVVTGLSTLTNQVKIESNDSTPGRIDYYCESSNAHYTRVQAAPHAQYSGNVTAILPIKSGDLIVGDTNGNITQNIHTTGIVTAGSFSGTVSGSDLSGALAAVDGSALTGIVTGIVAGSNVTVSNSGGTYTIAASGGGGGGAGGAGTLVIGYGSTSGDTPNVVGTATTINFVGTGYTVSIANSVATVRNVAMGMTTLEFTSVGYGATINEGAQISYTATASDANARFYVESSPVGLGQIGINYASGVMGGGQNASAGTYDVKLRAGTHFALSEPFNVRFVVDSFTLSMNTMFGDPTTFVMNTDDSDDATFISLSTGGVVSYDGSNYVIDRTNANYGTATKHALYYDNTNNVLYGFRTNSSNNAISGIYKWTSVTSASHGTNVGSGTGQQTSSWATTGAVSASSGIHTSSSGAGIAAYQPGGNYTHFYGSAFAMTIATTGGIMNNFGTNLTDWAYGFTLEDPWLITAAGNQLLAPESIANGWHNFGAAIFNISSTEYDYICYGENGYGPYTTGSFTGGISRVSNTNNIANAGDTVQVRFDGTLNGYYYLYINGVLKITTSSPDTYMSGTNTTNPTLSFGDTSNQNGGTIINDYAKGMPWPFRIRDMWIANNGNISASDLSGVASLNNRNVSTWSEYSDVDVYFTMNASGVTAVKGSPTIARKAITFPDKYL